MLAMRRRISEHSFIAFGAIRHRQKRPEPFGDRRVRDNRIAEFLIGELRQHCHLHRGNDLIGLGMRSSSPATTTFMKPCVSSVASVRNTLHIGSLATRTMMPCRCASPSLSPTRASGGSVNMQYGTSRSRVLRCPPADIAAYLKAYKAEGYEVHAV